MRRVAIIAAMIAIASAAMADGPETSLRPMARVSAAAVPQSDSAPIAVTRPAARPVTLKASDSGTEEATEDASRFIAQPVTKPAEGPVSSHELHASVRPMLRPLAIGREEQQRKEARARGSVCGDPAIQGETVGQVPGSIEGCGIEDAVKVRSVGGVALSQHALMDCKTAGAIKHWIDQGMKPAIGSYGGGVAQLRVAGHYVCRPRNNQTGAKISEHGKGSAIDIAAFQLRDGRTISVLNDWGGGQKGRILSQMHRSACGPFGTVLGPGANRFHHDHFHFDTAQHSNGSYCQ